MLSSAAIDDDRKHSVHDTKYGVHDRKHSVHNKNTAFITYCLSWGKASNYNKSINRVGNSSAKGLTYY